MDNQVTTRVFNEGRTFVAHAVELDVASCGGTKEEAVAALRDAVRLFLEEAERMGTLSQILAEAGYAGHECFTFALIPIRDGGWR